MASLPTLLPTPSAESQAISQQLSLLIQQKIAQAGGWISFAEFMHMALYTPSLGYYSGGAKKFADLKTGGGDFVTAPEISPLFAQTLALQAEQILAATQSSNLISNILELGAGTGKLAVDLLLELDQLNCLPEQYFILEVSAHLRQVQLGNCQTKLPDNLFDKLVWLDELPKKFNGLVLGNEVLDAIPAHIIHKTAEGWCERGVSFEAGFIWRDNLINDVALPAQINFTEHLPPNLAEDLPIGYITEVNPAASALVRGLADMLGTGAILLIDYGFGAAEYYHPQRNQGTLMCHYQHLVHDNPLTHVGLQDITAHINFTEVALACNPIPVDFIGYLSQAQFLINCGILSVLQRHSPADIEYMKLAAAAQKLLSPAEMGELFKVMCFSKNINEPLMGFVQGDKAHTLTLVSSAPAGL
jgi:SAM-dependent MidA family methyltransferase